MTAWAGSGAGGKVVSPLSAVQVRVGVTVPWLVSHVD